MAIVTVAMPVYNAMPHLPEAVESILSQTFEDFVFVIVDDGSTDASGDYLDSLTDPRIHLVHQENRGAGVTANRTLELTTTPFYARMDADDVAHPARLATQLSYFQQHPDLVLLGSQINFRIVQTPLEAPPLPRTHERLVAELLRGRPVICHPAMMVRTEHIREAGGYRLPNAGEDLDLFLRMAERGRIGNLTDVLLDYRLHMESLSSTHRKEVQQGVAYAMRCAAARRSGQPEPTLEAFVQQWQDRSWLTRFRDNVRSWSSRNYRSGMIHLAQKKYIRGFGRLFLSALLRPRRGVEQVTGRTWRRLTAPVTAAPASRKLEP